MKKLIFLLVIAALVLMPSAAMAGGPGGKGGSIIRVPDDYATIQAAIDSASDGDTIYVDEGTYEECLLIDGVDLLLIAVGDVTIEAPAPFCSPHGDTIQIYNSTGTVSDTTGSDGTVTFSTGNMSGGTAVTFTVKNVEHATLIHDATANHDPDGDSDGTTITVSK